MTSLGWLGKQGGGGIQGEMEDFPCLLSLFYQRSLSTERLDLVCLDGRMTRRGWGMICLCVCVIALTPRQHLRPYRDDDLDDGDGIRTKPTTVTQCPTLTGEVGSFINPVAQTRLESQTFREFIKRIYQTCTYCKTPLTKRLEI